MDLKGRVLAEVERSNKERPKKESRHNEGVVCEVQMRRLTYCGQVTLLHGYAHGHRQRGSVSVLVMMICLERGPRAEYERAGDDDLTGARSQS